MPPKQGAPWGQVPRAYLERVFSGSTAGNAATGPKGLNLLGHRPGSPVGLSPGLGVLLPGSAAVLLVGARQGRGLAQTTCESSGRLEPPLGAHHAGHRKKHLLSHTGPRWVPERRTAEINVQGEAARLPGAPLWDRVEADLRRNAHRVSRSATPGDCPRGLGPATLAGALLTPTPVAPGGFPQRTKCVPRPQPCGSGPPLLECLVDAQETKGSRRSAALARGYKRALAICRSHLSLWFH